MRRQVPLNDPDFLIRLSPEDDEIRRHVMSKPYTEPHTADCESDAHNSCHMHDVLDGPDLEFITEDIARDNIVYIKGVAHLLTWFSTPDEQGHRAAKLEVWKPF